MRPTTGFPDTQCVPHVWNWNDQRDIVLRESVDVLLYVCAEESTCRQGRDLVRSNEGMKVAGSARDRSALHTESLTLCKVYS